MGEFGAVSGFQAAIRIETNTSTAIAEIAYNEYNMTATVCVVASLLALLALVTLIVQQALKTSVANDE